MINSEFFDINYLDIYEETPLYNACIYNDYYIINLLLNQKN